MYRPKHFSRRLWVEPTLEGLVPMRPARCWLSALPMDPDSALERRAQCTWRNLYVTRFVADRHVKALRKRRPALRVSEGAEKLIGRSSRKMPCATCLRKNWAAHELPTVYFIWVFKDQPRIDRGVLRILGASALHSASNVEFEFHAETNSRLGGLDPRRQTRWSPTRRAFATMVSVGSR